MDNAGNEGSLSTVQSGTTHADTSPPLVINTDPAYGASGVPVTKSIPATFNEQVLASSVSTFTFIVKNSAGTSIPGTVSLSQGDTVATFAPSSSLAFSTSYTATIKGGSTGVKDLAGNARTSDKVWPFTTAADTSPPLVINTNPTYGASGVPVTKSITATFNEQVLASSVSTFTFIVKNSAGISIPGTVSLSQGDTVATFAPSSSLAFSTSYTATIKGGSTGVKDLAGNARTSDKVWPFTTAADTSPPLVINTDPAYGASGVPVTKSITATFNEQVLASSVSTFTFIVKNSAGTSIPGTVSLSQGDTVATFAPSSSLAFSTSYTATIKGGSTGVKDLAGNARTSDKVWPFTTAGGYKSTSGDKYRSSLRR